MQAKRGFTLVEILIVVVILGILAAIVIPQFTQASTEAKLNSLCSDLQTLRSQVELFKVQHNDMPPGNTAADGEITPDVTSFENQMIYCTDIDGNVKAGANSAAKTRDDTYKFGPYLERVPENPFTSSAVVAGWNAATAEDGWDFNPATGEIKAAPDSTPDSATHQTY
ncbi:MAG: type II secretion system protein [Phycisphaerales bacterium]|jgi:general secretion pathway protein G